MKSFGITWEGPSKQKKMVKRDSKELKELYLTQHEVLEEIIAEGPSSHQDYTTENVERYLLTKTTYGWYGTYTTGMLMMMVTIYLYIYLSIWLLVIIHLSSP